MSIINEALRKVQQDRTNEQQKNLSVTVYGKVSRKKTVLMITAGILTVTALLIMILSKQIRFATTLHHVKQAALKTKYMLPNKMKVVLNGVFVSDHSKIAYVNNEVFQVGDDLNGMKIVAINLDTITLQDENREIKIRTGSTYLL